MLLPEHSEQLETGEDIESVGRLLDERLRKLHAEQQEILSFGY